VTTTHPVDIYGGYQHPPGMLEQLADAIRTGAIPMQLEHDLTQTIDAKCLRAEVVDLDDGHKAVDAEFDVPLATIEAVGDRKGMSFAYSETIMMIPESYAGVPKLALFADPAHFDDAAIREASRILSPDGPVAAGRYRQFNAIPTCKVVVEYVHESGGVDGVTVAVGVGVGLVANAITEGIKGLLRRRRSPRERQDEPANIELHIVHGSLRERAILRTNDEGVIDAAIAELPAAIETASHYEWDGARGMWLPCD
jgi:hypothetical protein